MSLFSVGDLHRCWSNTNQMHLHFPSKFFYQHNQQFLPICAWNSSFRVVLATPNTSINPSSCTAFTLRSRMITLWFISKSTRSLLMSQLELRQSSPEQSNFCSFSVCFTFFGHEIEKENVDISIEVCTKCSYYFHIILFVETIKFQTRRQKFTFITDSRYEFIPSNFFCAAAMGSSSRQPDKLQHSAFGSAEACTAFFFCFRGIARWNTCEFTWWPTWSLVTTQL